MSVLLFAGACGGNVTGSSEVWDSSQDIKASNGQELNGQRLNGTRLNGQRLNGMRLNGQRLNGSNFSGGTIEAKNVTLDKTEFVATLADGRTVRGKDFIGSTFIGILSDGSDVTMRMDDITQSTKDSNIYLYSLTAKDSTGKFVPVCTRLGVAVPAIPVLGTWRSDGTHDVSNGQFTFACQGIGAIAKCVEMKYRPWEHRNYHEACVRMVRADYCGNGTAYTHDGNLIDVYDRLEIQKDDHKKYDENWYFDAEWNEHGATCIAFKGRPSANSPPCFYQQQNNDCSSSSKFSNGSILKNWVRYPKGFQAVVQFEVLH